MPVATTLDHSAADVLRVARQIAQGRGERRVSSHVLLVALSQAAEPPVRQALAGFGMGPTDAQAWLDTAIGPVPSPAPFDEASPYAGRTAAILEMASVEALEAGSPVVRSRDILFGILREAHAATGIVGAVLLACGATHSALRASLG
jgi:ATP-dependent Clp protease ATP-binding subunit ClpA